MCPGAGVFEPSFSNFWNPPSGTGQEGDGGGGGGDGDGMRKHGSVDEISASRYKALDINLTHPIRCTQLAISHFLSRYPAGSQLPAGVKSRGIVIHVSSVAAQGASLAVPLYDASKAGLSHFVRAMSALEPRYGIRVVCVAPGLVKTPLWTDNPDKLEYVDENVNEWAMAEEVADVMLDCLQSAEKVGGTIWEVGKNQLRRVEALNDPGPTGPGFFAAGVDVAYNDVYQKLEQKGWGQ